MLAVFLKKFADKVKKGGFLLPRWSGQEVALPSLMLELYLLDQITLDSVRKRTPFALVCFINKEESLVLALRLIREA